MDELSFIEVSHSDTDIMNMIGALRYRVWDEEQSINKNAFPDQCWLDDLDVEGRHWIVKNANNDIVASARLTLHHSSDDSYRDMILWKNAGKVLPLPTVDLGRLVVLNSYRGKGIAQQLNMIRIKAAKEMGAKSIMVTASVGNMSLLKKLGFEEIGEQIYFDDRPGTCFYALQLNLY
eukprot:gene7467-10178_t